jgi:ATP-dependent DNA ligase
MIIYKKDSKGNIRSLEIYAEDGRLYQISGLIDGAKVTHEKECKPKNIGKTNSTTSIAQAELEAEALITKKLSEGYFETLKETNTEEVILPMLAKVYSEECHKIDWSKPVFAQPKLDGMRAFSIEDDTLISRQNKSIDTLSHLNSEISILRNCGIKIPDGEVYAHGISFQENMKLIKKYRPGETENVKFHIYDQISNKSFEKRYLELEDVFLFNKFSCLTLVPTYRITSENELIEYHQKFISEGYEGSIIRYGEEPYKVNGRSSNLLKYKDFKDMDYCY